MSWWDDAVGRVHEIRRTFTADDLMAYHELIGSAPTQDGSDVVPEPLIAGLFSKILGVDLPGPGSNYLKQRLQFPGSAAVGEELTARVEITRVVPDKRLVYLSTICQDRDGRVVADGSALVLAGGVPGVNPGCGTESSHVAEV